MSDFYLAHFVPPRHLYVLNCTHGNELIITRNIFHWIVLCLHMHKINHSGSGWTNTFWTKLIPCLPQIISLQACEGCRDTPLSPLPTAQHQENTRAKLTVLQTQLPSNTVKILTWFDIPVSTGSAPEQACRSSPGHALSELDRPLGDTAAKLSNRHNA